MNIKEKFIQIQKVLNKISQDKNLKEKFLSAKSSEEKFNLTKEICENSLSTKPIYSIDDFNKFETFSIILNEIGNDKDALEKIKQIKDPSEMYSLVSEKLISKGIEAQTNQQEFMDFIFSVSFSVQYISPDDITNVTGGATSIAPPPAAVMSGDYSGLLNSFYTTATLQQIGEIIGQSLSKTILTIRMENLFS